MNYDAEAGAASEGLHELYWAIVLSGQSERGEWTPPALGDLTRRRLATLAEEKLARLTDPFEGGVGMADAALRRLADDAKEAAAPPPEECPICAEGSLLSEPHHARALLRRAYAFVEHCLNTGFKPGRACEWLNDADAALSVGERAEGKKK